MNGQNMKFTSGLAGFRRILYTISGSDPGDFAPPYLIASAGLVDLQFLAEDILLVILAKVSYSIISHRRKKLACYFYIVHWRLFLTQK
jgi:hypothetical protein